MSNITAQPVVKPGANASSSSIPLPSSVCSRCADKGLACLPNPKGGACSSCQKAKRKCALVAAASSSTGLEKNLQDLALSNTPSDSSSPPTPPCPQVSTVCRSLSRPFLSEAVEFVTGEKKHALNGLALDLGGRRRVSPELNQYFLEDPTESEREEVRRIRWTDSDEKALGTEAGMRELVAKLEGAVPLLTDRIVTGGRRTQKKVPGEDHKTKLESARSHVVVLYDVATIGTEATQREIADLWGEQVEGRSWAQVGAVAELKQGKDEKSLEREAQDQMEWRLHSMVTTPGKGAAVGFTLVNARLTFYFLTPSGLFISLPHDCKPDCKPYILSLLRLLRLPPSSLGLYLTSATLSEKPHITPHCLPPLVPESFNPSYNKDSRFLITSVIADRITSTGRCTSAFAATVVSKAGIAEASAVIKVSFVQEERLYIERSVYRKIRTAEPSAREHLASAVAEYCSEDFKLGWGVIGFNDALGLVPRTMQVLIFEEEYLPLSIVRSPGEMKGVIAGALKGLHALYQLGFLLNDIQPGNVMIRRKEDGLLTGVVLDYNLCSHADGTRSEAFPRSGTYPFMARRLIQRAGFLREHSDTLVHRWWYDIESVYFLVVYLGFRKGAWRESMDDEASQIWESWGTAAAFQAKQGLKQVAIMDMLLEAVDPLWRKGIESMLEVLKDGCGIGLPDQRVAAEDDMMAKREEAEGLPHLRLATRLNQLEL